MTTADLWTLVHEERAALAADLAPLTDDRWATPSLCAGLSVREVLAHLASAASLTPLRWLAGVIPVPVRRRQAGGDAPGRAAG